MIPDELREDIHALINETRETFKAQKTKVDLIFAWYDIWVGIFIDKKKRVVYVFPIPMFGIKITLGGKAK